MSQSRAQSFSGYSIYQPNVVHGTVYNAASGRGYNHDSSVVFFDDHWFSFFDAHSKKEAQPGQRIWMTKSRDFTSWSVGAHKSVAPFVAYSYSQNPVSFGRSNMIQWQPGTIVVDNKLMVFWNQIIKRGEDQSTKDHGDQRNREQGVFMSTLDSADGLFKNKRILFEGHPNPVLPDIYQINQPAIAWRVFPGTNPIELKQGHYQGRLLVPVSLRHDYPCSPNEDCLTPEFRQAMMISDDRGATWRISEMVPGADRYRHQTWEPTVVEVGPGVIRVYIRDKDLTRPIDQRLIHSLSSDGGESWSNMVPTRIETHSSRPYALDIPGDRKLMLHHDYPGLRYNLAMFFSQTGQYDWVAGNGLQTPYDDNGHFLHYPQAYVRDNHLYVTYTESDREKLAPSTEPGGLPEKYHNSIRSAKIQLPESNKKYVFPRTLHPELGLNGDIRLTDSERQIIELSGRASAGIESPTADMFKGETLEGKIRFQTPKKSELKKGKISRAAILTVGDAHNYARIDFDSARGRFVLRTFAGGKIVDSALLGKYKPETRYNLSFEVRKRSILIGIDDRPKRSLPLNLQSPRVYLGAAYAAEAPALKRNLTFRYFLRHFEFSRY